MRNLTQCLALCLILVVAADAASADPRTPHRARIRTMNATAFAGTGDTTAAGTEAHEGIVAADPAVLPLGTRIRVTRSNGYDGVYLVTDTGAKVNGAHIDLCLRSAAEAKEFGKRRVRVQILGVGTGPESARQKDGDAMLHRPQRPQ
ncbi:MAG: 3D domain-containing protein [Candidatus Solibacter sp.]